MRILDCKNEECTNLTQGAPQVSECLCEECNDHFEQLKSLLENAGIKYILNSRIVRGLDYYTKTAFEIQYAPLGAQSAVCGGGRYDGLIEECGGQPTPGIGFAIGLERVMLALEKQNLLPKLESLSDVFVVPLDKNSQGMAFKIMTLLRQQGLVCDMDFAGRSLKAQMKQANKRAARYVAIIGEDEVKSGQVLLKDMHSGEQQLVDFSEVYNKIVEMRN
jgi:histidyl-tRNA synthetase